jgi:DNA-binding CsgD family transcriptional regulator
MDRRSVEKTKKEVLQHCHEGLDVASLARALSQSLQYALPFDGWCWHTIDPATTVLTGAIRPAFGSDPRFARYEYTVPDVNKFSYLARKTPTAGILSDATHGMLQTSSRYRDLLRPLGIEHELRASFVADDGSWAACALYRPADARDFSSEDAELLASLSSMVAEGFKRALLIADPTLRFGDEGPGIVLLDEDDEIQSMTTHAERMIDDFIDLAAPRKALPTPVYAVAARARAAADGRGAQPAFARLITRSGRWLTLHGSRLRGKGAPLTAVILEPARAAHIAPLIVRAFGLTSREEEISRLVLKGLSTKEIAYELHLSPLTVQDHLKSVFAKSGVHSRRDLVAKVFLDHYAPRIARADTLQGNGSFA